jgi:hypothetical protein
MSKSIEIFENTLLKLIIRSGTDSDRKTIVLDSGELGYTTDTNRLYVGNGTTPGGILVGNVFNGSRADVTTGGGNPAIGDLAFDTDNKILYRLESSNFSNLSSWQAIGGVYSAGNNTIRFSSTNTVSVCSLSANNISQDALGRSITLDSGRITLSSTVAVNNIITNTSTFLTLPSALNINSNTYRFPSTPLSANTYLSTDASGNLSWSNISSLLSSASSARVTVGSGLTATVNGTPQTTFQIVSGQNISLGGVFLPTAHATFTQSGNILRSTGITQVLPVPFSDIATNYGGPIKLYGYDAEPSNSRYDYPGVHAYVLTTSQPIDTSSVVINVEPKNATYMYDDTLASFLAKGPTIVPYYRIVTSTQLLVFFYVVPINIKGSPRPALVTPGYSDINNTRFSVTIYG